MKKTLRLLMMLAVMMAVMGIILSCSIRDDNGSPAHPGDPGDTGNFPCDTCGPGYEPGYVPPPNAVPLIVLDPEDRYALPGTDFTVGLTLFADTAAGASRVHGDTIAVYLGAVDVNDNEALLISPTLIVITGGLATNSGADKVLVTDSKGEASFTFKTQATGTAQITFRYKGQDATLRIPVSTTPPPPPVPLIRIDPESNYVKPGQDLKINLMLLADTSLWALPIRGDTIIVVKNPNAVDDTLLIDPSLIVIEGAIAGERLITDIQGRASYIFSSLKEEGYEELTFRYKGRDATMKILVTGASPATRPNIVISATPTVLAADGTSKSVVTVLVKDSLNNPCVSDTIRFTSSAGLITAQAITDASGRATAELTSERRNVVAEVKAFPKSSPDSVATISVEFGGVRVRAVSDKPTIRPNGVDSCVISAVLTDAAGNVITGERITFKSSLASGTTSITDTVTTTDVRGEATAVVKRSTASAVPDSIRISAAGADYKVPVYFSENIVDIVPADTNVYEIGKNVAFTAYLRDVNNAPIPNATFEISATTGTNMDDNGNNIFAQTKTSVTGRVLFTIDAPQFQDSATIYVRARPTAGGEYTASSRKVFFKAAAIDRVVVTSTPAVIPWNNGRATITATAYDNKMNPVTGALIAFNIVKAPGGSEYIDPPTAVTKADGTATVTFFAGMVPSTLGGVEIRASDFNGEVSNTTTLTITGPPRYVTVRRNMGELVKYPTTYGKKFSALVSDVNRNPVADGTEVTFSADIIGYEFYRKSARFFTKDPNTGERDVEIGFSGVLIDNEYRGEYDAEGRYVRRNGPSSFPAVTGYNPYPAFDDINKNGRPDGVIGGISGLDESCFYYPDGPNGRKLLSQECNNPVEPCDTEDPLWNADFSTMQMIIGWRPVPPVCYTTNESERVYVRDTIRKDGAGNIVKSISRDSIYAIRTDTIFAANKDSCYYMYDSVVVISRTLDGDTEISRDTVLRNINPNPLCISGRVTDTVYNREYLKYIVINEMIVRDTVWSNVPAGTEVCTDQPSEPIYAKGGPTCMLWADYNGNNVWDWEETFMDKSYSESQRKAMYESDPFATNPVPYWDIDWNRNGVPDPATTVLVTRTVLTKDGIAENELIYGQSDALRIEIRLTAEAKGFEALSAEEFLLPIAESDEKFWDPFRE